MSRADWNVGPVTRYGLFWTLLPLTLSGLSGCTTGEASPSTALAPIPARHVVSIAAASDLKFALDDLAKRFEQAEPDVELRITHGSSGNFFAQIRNHAPFDVYLSADREYPERLIKEGLAMEETLVLYGIGHLVIWVPNDSPLDPSLVGMEALVDAAAHKVAIANPAHAPYGRAAVAALQHAGIYDRVRDRLVLGENVTQAAQYVASGAADAGIIALSLASAPIMRDKGRYWQVPPDSYPRLDQAGVILSSTKDLVAARKFTSYLSGEHGRQILQSYGFALPGE